MSEKIRIISYQNANNYGAVLQAYGLQETLKQLGCEDVKFINYNPYYLKKRYSPFEVESGVFRNFRSVIAYLINFPFRTYSILKRNCLFNKSRRKLLSQTCIEYGDYKKIAESFDLLICGSDQIWNTNITGDYDPAYFGIFNRPKQSRVISYAPSTELSNLNEANAKRIIDNLQHFADISVRENSVYDYLKQFTDKPIEVCVDPTILCGSRSFLEVTSKRKIQNDYIIIYAYDHKDALIEYAYSKIPDLDKYELHVLLLGPRGIKSITNRYIHSEITVEDFLSYIKYASFVVTNSFHGLAFSLLFEKNFNVVLAPGKQARCVSLLQQIGLMSRFVKEQNNISWDTIDYTGVNHKIDDIRQASINYLKRNIKI